MKYTFVGSRSEIIGENAQVFSQYGQVAELDQAFAESHIAHQHLPLIPSDEFDEIGSIPKDATALAAHSFAARQKLHDNRLALKAKEIV